MAVKRHQRASASPTCVTNVRHMNRSGADEKKTKRMNSEDGQKMQNIFWAQKIDKRAGFGNLVLEKLDLVADSRCSVVVPVPDFIKFLKVFLI